MEKICSCTEVVYTAEDAIREALRRIACAYAKQNIRDRTVVVVNDAHWVFGGSRCDVGGGGDRSARIDGNIAAVNVFGELTGAGRRERRTGNGSP
jgi:hypothetical protein